MKTIASARAALRGCLVLAALALPTLAVAHEGHDDEEPQAAAVATAPAAGNARFAAASEQFELVGVLDARTLTLYLDRFADNAPVEGAQLDLDLGGERLAVGSAGQHYVAQLSAPPPAGTIPVTATVIAGDAVDLLAGELVVAQTESSADAHARSDRASPGWSAAAAWPGLAIAAGLASASWVVTRRRSRK